MAVLFPIICSQQNNLSLQNLPALNPVCSSLKIPLLTEISLKVLSFCCLFYNLKKYKLLSILWVRILNSNIYFLLFLCIGYFCHFSKALLVYLVFLFLLFCLLVSIVLRFLFTFIALLYTLFCFLLNVFCSVDPFFRYIWINSCIIVIVVVCFPCTLSSDVVIVNVSAFHCPHYIQFIYLFLKTLRTYRTYIYIASD